MTTAAPTVTATAIAPPIRPGIASRFAPVISAEWTKLRTIRSPRAMLIAGYIAVVGGGALLTFFINRNFSSLPADSPFEPVRSSFGGLVLGQLAMVVLGVTMIGGEYASGMIRATLAAVPERGLLLAAKAVVLAAVTLAAGLVTAFSAFFVGQAMLGKHGVGIGDPNVLRAVLGGAVYLTLIALFSLGVTTMLRRQTLALGILMPFFFLVSGILQAIPGVTKATQFLPDQAGQKFLQIHHQSKDAFGPWTGALITAAWVALALLGGWASLRRRDA
jgi:ABC-type transport system involved in multi-copper enzyme maturation permease subunit